MTPPTSTPTPATAPAPDQPPAALRHSPLEACHRALDAKLVGFGGWLMPLTYPTGTLAERHYRKDDVVTSADWLANQLG